MKKGEASRARLKEKAQKLVAERMQEHNRQYDLQMTEATRLAGEISKAYVEANQFVQSKAYQQAVEAFIRCRKCLSALKRLTLISATINIESGEIDMVVAQCYFNLEQPDNCVISAKLACLQGYSVEMEELGVRYFRSNQFAPAMEILWAVYKQKKSLQLRESYESLGWLIINGFGKKEIKHKKYPLAIEILSVAENQGSSYAAFALGVLYYECENEKYRDLKKARKCFEKAAEDVKRPESHLQLGLLLTDLQDYQSALMHYKKAIEAGLKGCYRNMGIIYDLILDDKASAIECYQKAIDENDDPYAMHNLGLMNQHGEGMPKNPKAALELYIRAIDRGFLDPCPNAANLMMMSNTGVERNPLKAEEYLRLAAKAKNPLALHCLAIYIRENKFPSQSPYEETLALLLEAAKLGNVESMYSYSILKGETTVGFDFDVAKWYKTAADLGYSLAQFNYALYLSQKKLVAMNDGDPEEFVVVSLILKYLEKSSQSKDVSLANTALIKLKAIKALGNTKKAIVEQLSQNKPSEVSNIEQEIASIRTERRRPQVQRIGRILQFFNATSSLSTQNIATALYSIAEIFDENSSLRRPFDEHSADIAKLVNFVTDHVEEFKINELANVFIGLSKLHMHPDNSVMARCLSAILPILQTHLDVIMLFDRRTVCYAATRFLLNSQHSDAVLFCKTLYDRILNQDFTARMGLKLSTESAYFVYIFHQCSSVQLPDTKRSLINLCEQASRFLKSTAEQRIIHQWLMINHFFKQQFNEPLGYIKATLKEPDEAMLADNQISRFEDEVADCLRRLGICFERQRVFNGIPVDFYLPDYDRILEANGPSHYLYGIGEPVLTPRDIARNKFIAKPISLLSYLEWAHWKDHSICDDQLSEKIKAESQDSPQKPMILDFH